ncbi:CdvA-like protein [Tardisphaera miroshnichenkoae]
MYFEEARDYLGKEVKDQYGRHVGTVLGIYTNTKDEVTSFELSVGDGQFEQVPFEMFVVSGGSLTLLKPWKLKAEDVIKEYAEALKREEALQELLRAGEIGKDIFDEMDAQLQTAISALKLKRDEVRRELLEQAAALDAKKHALSAFIANAKMQHRLGDLDDQSFQDMLAFSNSALNGIRAEREDVSITLDQINRLGVETKPVEKVVEPEPKVVEKPVERPPAKEGEEAIVVKMEEDNGGA